MAQVIWTTVAALELAEATQFMKNYSKTYADNFARKLYARSGQLANFPEMGRVIPEIDKRSIANCWKAITGLCMNCWMPILF